VCWYVEMRDFYCRSIGKRPEPSTASEAGI
jgi:hypothetical protein